MLTSSDETLLLRIEDCKFPFRYPTSLTGVRRSLADRLALPVRFAKRRESLQMPCARSRRAAVEARRTAIRRATAVRRLSSKDS